MFELILLITVVASVITSSYIDNVSLKTVQFSTYQKMFIIDYSRGVESCLEYVSGDKSIDAETLDKYRDERIDLDEICSSDLLGDLYVKIEIINNDRVWEFGKSKGNKKKASHMSWINVKFKSVKEIQNQEDFQLESGDYEIRVEKVNNGILEKDAIKISFSKLMAEDFQEFDIREKVQIKNLYDEIVKDDEGVIREFSLKVPENEIYDIGDFVVEGYKFRKFGDSYSIGSGRPIWFSTEGEDSIDMGTLYVEI